MRVKDIKKAGTYLRRIAGDPFSKQSRAAMGRYVVEAYSFVYEKIRGLDFTMIYQCDSNEHNNNYSKSPKRVLKRVFDDIDFSVRHSFRVVSESYCTEKKIADSVYQIWRKSRQRNSVPDIVASLSIEGMTLRPPLWQVFEKYR